MPHSSSSSSPTPTPKVGRFSIGLNVFLQLVLLLTLFGIVNYLSYRHFIRRDLSPNKDYTLSEYTQNYIKRLSKNVDLTLIYTRESPAMQEVRSLLESYRDIRKSRISTEEIDPVRDMERAEELKLKHNITLQSNGILVQANNRIKFIPEEDIIIRGLSGNRDNPSVDFRGEDAVTSTIIHLLEGETRRLYFVTGKGEASGKGPELPFVALSAIGTLQNFEVAPLNLTEVTEIPNDANALVIVGPKYDFSESEIKMIETYWATERAAIFILLDPNGQTPRLRQFISAHGVTPRPDRVLYAESTATGPRKEFSVNANFSPDSPITQPLQTVTTTFSGQSQSLDLKTESPELRARQIEVLPLITANERFWGETRYLLELPRVDPEDTQPPVYLGASIERGHVRDARLRVDSARMVVVSNALLLDPATRLDNHQTFVINSVNWMLSREKLIGIPSVRKQTFRLELTNDQRTKIFWVTALVFPGGLLALGFMIWSFRRA